MSNFVKKNKRMEIQPNPERIGTVLPAIKGDEAVPLSQLKQYGATVPYKKYVANLTQSGTSAPIATILENTLGSVVFTYDSTGYYIGTLTGAFTTASKCCFFTSKQFPIGDTGGVVVNKDVSINRDDSDSFHIASESGGAVANSVLNNTTIEIRVY